MIDLGVKLGLVDKSGAWYGYNGNRIGQGKSNSCRYLEENPEILREIEDAIRQQLLGTGQGAHEISIRFVDPEDGKNAALPLFEQLTNASNEALGWLQISPQIGAMIEMVDYSTLIMGLVLYLLAALGIINSLFMSIYERIYEFGVIKALGTQPRQLMNLILSEAMLLAILGLVIGLIFGATVLDIWSSDTSPKALLGLGWTVLLLVGLFLTGKNEKS